MVNPNGANFLALCLMAEPVKLPWHDIFLKYVTVLKLVAFLFFFFALALPFHVSTRQPQKQKILYTAKRTV